MTKLTLIPVLFILCSCSSQKTQEFNCVSIPQNAYTSEEEDIPWWKESIYDSLKECAEQDEKALNGKIPPRAIQR